MDSNTSQLLVSAVSSVGFPIVVCFYLLTRFQSSMDRFTAQIGELVQIIRAEHEQK